MIIRAQHRDRYLIIDQRIVEDARLSWASRGLLAYLLSRPEDWKVLIKDLQRRGDLGRDGVYSLLKELRSFGYVHYQPSRDEQGRLRGGYYSVREIPLSPHPAGPETVKPDSASPGTAGAGALLNTENYLRTIPVSTDRTKLAGQSMRKDNPKIEFGDWIPNEIRSEALKKIAGIKSPFNQMLIDEWSDGIAQNHMEGSELAYLDTLLRGLPATKFRQKVGG